MVMMSATFDMIHHKSHHPSYDSAGSGCAGDGASPRTAAAAAAQARRAKFETSRRRQLDLANTRCSLGGLVASDDCSVLLSRRWLVGSQSFDCMETRMLLIQGTKSESLFHVCLNGWLLCEDLLVFEVTGQHISAHKFDHEHVAK